MNGKLLLLLLLFVSPATVVAQGAPGTTHEFRAAVMTAVQDSDDMDNMAIDLQWQFARSEARKSATAVIRQASNDVELKIAGAVWDLYQAKVTCRIEAAAGSSLDHCHAETARLRSLALAQAGIAPARLYPHVQN